LPRADLFPEPSQTRAKLDLFAVFFSQPFISNLAKGKRGGEGTGGDGKRLEKTGEMGITIRRMGVDTRKQGKVTLISEKVFLQPVLL